MQTTKILLLILSLDACLIFGLAVETNHSGKEVPKESNAIKEQIQVKNEDQQKKDIAKDHIGQDNMKKKTNVPNSSQTNSVDNISSNPNISDKNEILPSNDVPSIEQESKYVTIGFRVLISISLLFMVFVAYKTYRRKSRNARIRKYGIKLTRGNIEMTPLPLDNDDDDETIFDLKNVPT